MTLVQLKYVITVATEQSLNNAAKKLFISQPSLSNAIRAVEKEIGMTIFSRSNSGITLTTQGVEFVGYARQVVEQYQLLDSKFVHKQKPKKKFSISMQHYEFAVDAFADMVQEEGMDEYEFSIFETRTYDVLESVKKQQSELGILYLNDFNQKVLNRLFTEYELEFKAMAVSDIFAYVRPQHPLAEYEALTLEDLADYPRLFFDQGERNSFFFSEEVLSNQQYKRLIRANDRGTLLSLIANMDAYTLGTGFLSYSLHKGTYRCIPLRPVQQVTIGYIKRKNVELSQPAKLYLEKLDKYVEGFHASEV